MTNRGAFAQLLAPGLQALMFEWLDEHPEEYSQFLNVDTSDRAYEEDQIIGGLGLVRRKPEGEQITYDDPIQGGTRRFIHDAYALGWQVTKEMKDDDQYAVIRKIPGELMKSVRQTVESLGADVLNLAFGSSMTTADGLSLCNTAHPLLGGGTKSNSLSPAADLSVTSLQDVVILYENTVNERGLKMRLMPKYLWIPPDLQFTAGEILQSAYKPGTGNNEINVMQGRLEPAVLHYLTSTTHWYVTADKSDHTMKLLWRAKPVTDSIDDFETKGTKHSIMFRISTGATDWRGIVGSSI